MQLELNQNWSKMKRKLAGFKEAWNRKKAMLIFNEKKRRRRKSRNQKSHKFSKLARINLKLRWYKIINNSLNKYVSTWSIRNNYNRSKRVKKSSLVSTRNSIVELLSITFHNYTTRLVLLHRYSQESECFPRRTKIRGQRKLVLAILSPLNTP